MCTSGTAALMARQIPRYVSPVLIRIDAGLETDLGRDSVPMPRSRGARFR